MNDKRATAALMARTTRKAYGTREQRYAEWLEQRHAQLTGLVTGFRRAWKLRQEKIDDLEEIALMYADSQYSH